MMSIVKKSTAAHPGMGLHGRGIEGSKRTAAEQSPGGRTAAYYRVALQDLISWDDLDHNDLVRYGEVEAGAGSGQHQVQPAAGPIDPNGTRRAS